MTRAVQVLGDYEIIRELGRGANGVVYAARRPGLERLFAVKVLLRFDPLDKEVLARFEREARLASKLEDPGIVAVYDVGSDPQGRPYYVMEYCDGETLADRLRAGPLPLVAAIDIVAELARILAVAHARGVVHRDVKPANVIMDKASGRPRITDFGLARDGTSGANLTRTGDLIGTPLYMSPEQLRGERHVDHRADVYALGVILYECLTGRRPFEAPTVIALASEVLSRAPLPPSKLRAAVPLTLDLVCRRALAKDPADRHRDGEDLRRDLLVARRRLEESAKPAPRSRPWALIAAVAVVLVVAAAGLGALAARRATGKAPPRGGAAPPQPAHPVAAPAAKPAGPPAPSAEARRLAVVLDELLARATPDVSLVVADVAPGEPLFATREAIPRAPAACLQLLTAAAAMKHCPGTELVTSLLAKTRPGRDGVLEGDVVVVGGGDPTMSDDVFDAWVSTLVESWGVKRITGDVIVDSRRFEGPAVNPELAPNDRYFYWGAPVVALSCADACIGIKLRMKPADCAPSPRVASLRVASDSRGSVARVDHERDLWLLTIPEPGHDAGDVCQWVPVSEPDLYAAELLRDRIAERIDIAGRVRRARDGERFEGWEAVASRATPVSTIVRHVGRRSQAWYAECLLRHAALGAGRAGSFEEGAAVATDLARASGASADEVQIVDGSGLGRSDRISARALAAVLSTALRAPTGETFARALNSLPCDDDGTIVKDRTVHRNLILVEDREPALVRLGVRIRAQCTARPEQEVTFAGVLERPGLHEGDEPRRVMVVFLAEGGTARRALLSRVLETVARSLAGQDPAEAREAPDRKR